MKRVGVFFSAPGSDDYPLSIEEYRRSYFEFSSLLQRKGAELLFVRSQRSYSGGNRFRGAWKFEGTDLVRVENDVSTDIIYNKGNLVPDSGANIVNHPELEKICTVKYRSYELLESVSPKFFVCDSAKSVSLALKALHGDQAVVKPIDGEGGEGVFVGRRDEIPSHVSVYPCIIQAFVDSSCGIPGLTPGRHELRIVSIGGEIVQCFIRVPRGDCFLANVAQGATTLEVDLTKVPTDARRVFEYVDAKLQRFHSRVYAVDMARDRDGRWMIIELNSKPSLFSLSRGPGFAYFQERLSDHLISLI